MGFMPLGVALSWPHYCGYRIIKWRGCINTTVYRGWSASVFLSPLHISLLVNRQKSPQTYLSHNDSETRTNQVQSGMGLGFSMFGVSSRASSYSFNHLPIRWPSASHHHVRAYMETGIILLVFRTQLSKSFRFSSLVLGLELCTYSMVR